MTDTNSTTKQSHAEQYPQTLNCEIGSLAITVRAKFGTNLGKVVRIVDSYGLMPWPEIEELVHVWKVEVASEDSFLHYFYPTRHHLDVVISGPIPDCYLKRIVPVDDQLRLEFDEEQTNKTLVPSAL
jgi:hypothetical protein